MAGVGNGENVMDIKASGRSAVIVAGLVIAGLCCAVPATPGIAAPQASVGDSNASAKPATKKKTARHHSRHVKKHAAAKPAAPVPADQDRAAAKPATEPKPLADASGVLPASIADANAQASTAEAGAAAPTQAATPFPAPTPTAAAAEPGLAAADQLNDLDRAATDTPQGQPQAQSQPPSGEPATVAMAQPQAQESASRDDAWDKASLVGKIFIAAGGLLTFASAARMFMA
jgi:hypothetical protein